MFDTRQPFLWQDPADRSIRESSLGLAEQAQSAAPVRRARAANFAALITLFGSEANAEKAWQLLERLYDVNREFDDVALNFIARADVPVDRARAALHRFFSAQQQLDPEDLILERGDPLYPHRLLDSGDAPRFIYVRQSEGILDRPSLAVVGTRNPTAEGSLRARKLGALLAKAGVVVVSGLAKGIDTAAHTGCIEAGGRTVAVVGTPLTQAYPKENFDLQNLIGHTGAVVSQFAPGATVTRASFPLRNATMSGLSLGTVVIEASETSGALIQARRALQQGRRLFIPRSAVDNEALSWPKHYAGRGAVVFSDIDELVTSLGIGPRLSTSIADSRSASLSA
ncbi:MAG: DNA-protecting protein DprA [Candidatus Eremiobacteraeota bacterium]|nr:DNA-protecting protein DprA [Candidatus Eremiobacteraeota bacterium]